METLRYSEDEHPIKEKIDIAKSKIIKDISENTEKLITELKIDEAINILKKGLSLEPGHPGMLADLGFTYILKNKPEDAKSCLEEANRKLPNNAYILSNLGTIYLWERNFIEAEKVLNLAHEIKATHFSFLGLGKVYLWTDRNEEAEKMLEKANNLRKDDEKILEMLGIAYLENYKYDKAEKIYGLIYKDNSRDPGVLTILIRIYLEKRNYKLASFYLNKANEIRKDDQYILTMLVIICIETKEYSKAYDILQKGLDLYPKNPYLLVCYGVLNIYQNRLDEAVHQFEEILKDLDIFSNEGFQ